MRLPTYYIIPLAVSSIGGGTLLSVPLVLRLFSLSVDVIIMTCISAVFASLIAILFMRVTAMNDVLLVSPSVAKRCKAASSFDLRSEGIRIADIRSVNLGPVHISSAYACFIVVRSVLWLPFYAYSVALHPCSLRYWALNLGAACHSLQYVP